MFFNSLERKLKKSYSDINKDIQPMVFPRGEQEYVYVGTMLNYLFKKQDVFQLMQIYVSVYTYYKLELGNSAKTFDYAKKKAAGVLSDYDCKTLIAFIMLNLTADKSTITDPVAKVNEYRGYVHSYLNTVEVIANNLWRFKTEPISAGTVNSPILVAGTLGVHEYINALIIPGVEKISFSRTSALSLTDEYSKISYVIDEYTLTDANTGTKIASLWFNIYGTENTNVRPVCFSEKTPFSAPKVAPELFSTALKQWKSIEKLCQNVQVSYDYEKLAIATFTYFLVIWEFSFANIRAGQASDLEDIYIDKFVQIFDNEQIFKNALKRVDKRVRVSYQANNHTLLDDGLSDEFISEFVLDKASASKIQTEIANIMMNDWANIGKKADQTYLT